MKRKHWLYLLIPLSAITALAQYATQGAMAGPHNPADFPDFFWYADYALWALRAIIESAVIVYLFQTRGETQGQRVMLAILEIALVALIAVTLGMTFIALGNDLDMHKIGKPWFAVWAVAIAAYTPLMMGSVGYAYKVQPEDEETQSIDPEALQRLAALEEQNTDLEARITALQAERDTAQSVATSVQVFGNLEPEQQVQWIAEHRNGEGPTNKQLAEWYGVAQSTIGRWINKEQAK